MSITTKFGSNLTCGSRKENQNERSYRKKRQRMMDKGQEVMRKAHLSHWHWWTKDKKWWEKLTWATGTGGQRTRSDEKSSLEPLALVDKGQEVMRKAHLSHWHWWTKDKKWWEKLTWATGTGELLWGLHNDHPSRDFIKFCSVVLEKNNFKWFLVKINYVCIFSSTVMFITIMHYVSVKPIIYAILLFRM